MLFEVYDEKLILRGSFDSIYDLEKFVDSVREDRGDRYPNTPRLSPFDYMKYIGWFWELKETARGEPVGEVAQETP